MTDLQEDGWKQIPGKIMLGDGLTWCANISLLYQRNRNGDYIVERIHPQPRLLQVLRDLPICTGVGVRRDVIGIKDFYSTISGETVKLKGFLDLSGFKLRARNMTVLGCKLWEWFLIRMCLQEMISGDSLGLSSLLASRFMGSKIFLLDIYVTLFLLVS